MQMGGWNVLGNVSCGAKGTEVQACRYKFTTTFPCEKLFNVCLYETEY